MVRRLSTQVLTRRRTVAAALVALVAAAGALAAASTSPARSSQADRLRAIETAREQALVDGDTAIVRRLTAPDFQLINPAGAPLSRDDFLGGVEAGAIDFLALDPSSPITVRMSGDSATLRYRTRFDLVVGGTRLTHEGWNTALYERRDGRWQSVWAQTTAIPNDPDLFLESIKPAS
jgi:uncharacterized protein DUF4440